MAAFMFWLWLATPLICSVAAFTIASWLDKRDAGGKHGGRR